MKINRLVADLGNSRSQFLIDGKYFEMASSVKIISESEARGSFAENIEEDMLLKELVLKISYNGMERFVKVGAKAEADVLSNTHIEKLHDKTSSDATFILWASAIAYYHSIVNPEIDDDAIKIENNYTMIPIWLAKKSDRFSYMIEKMADRFRTPIEIELLTQGYERVLRVKVVNSKARIEGETGRFGLKYNLDLKLQDSAKTFENAFVVVNDVGGQTQDLCKLQKKLSKPASADDFQSFTDLSFLKMLEQLRKDKLMTHFTDVRALEEFIVNNAESRNYSFTDPTTWETDDLKPVIMPTLSRFAQVVIEKCLNAFAGSFKTGEEVYFIHTGGVTEVLKPYLQEYLVERLGEHVAKERHIFPAEGRKLNLYGLEIVAKDEAVKKEGRSHESKEEANV